MTAPADRRCPICQRPAAPPGERSPTPFCSPRCQMVDLGRWLHVAYVISEPVELEGLPPRESGDRDDDES
jgi:endogenous inhibitor of DNA gyrase (YacG/DUF329 family)